MLKALENLEEKYLNLSTEDEHDYFTYFCGCWAKTTNELLVFCKEDKLLWQVKNIKGRIFFCPLKDQGVHLDRAFPLDFGFYASPNKAYLLTPILCVQYKFGVSLNENSKLYEIDSYSDLWSTLSSPLGKPCVSFFSDISGLSVTSKRSYENLNDVRPHLYSRNWLSVAGKLYHYNNNLSLFPVGTINDKAKVLETESVYIKLVAEEFPEVKVRSKKNMVETELSKKYDLPNIWTGPSGQHVA